MSAVKDRVGEGKMLMFIMKSKMLITVLKLTIIGLWILRPSLDRIWIEAKYRRLQQYSYNCGILRHDMNMCAKESKSSQMAGYGAWSCVGFSKPLERMLEADYEIEFIESKIRDNQCAIRKNKDSRIVQRSMKNFCSDEGSFVCGKDPPEELVVMVIREGEPSVVNLDVDLVLSSQFDDNKKGDGEYVGECQQEALVVIVFDNGEGYNRMMIWKRTKEVQTDVLLLNSHQEALIIFGPK